MHEDKTFFYLEIVRKKPNGKKLFLKSKGSLFTWYLQRKGILFPKLNYERIVKKGLFNEDDPSAIAVALVADYSLRDKDLVAEEQLILASI
jgi:hypothetical protein